MIVTSRHYVHCMHCLRFKRNMLKKQIKSYKQKVFDMEYGTYFTHDTGFFLHFLRALSSWKCKKKNTLPNTVYPLFTKMCRIDFLKKFDLILFDLSTILLFFYQNHKYKNEKNMYIWPSFAISVVISFLGDVIQA